MSERLVKITDVRGNWSLVPVSSIMYCWYVSEEDQHYVCFRLHADVFTQSPVSAETCAAVREAWGDRPDDDVPVDARWFRSLDRSSDESGESHVDIRVGGLGGKIRYTNDGVRLGDGAFHPCDWTTRGEVRKLAAACKIDLGEPRHDE